MPTTLEERTRLLLGKREVKRHPWRPGVMLMQGKRPGQLYEVDVLRGECTCEDFRFGKGGIKRQAYTDLSLPVEQVVEVPARIRWCKHLQLFESVLPICRELVAAKVVVPE